MNDDKALTEKEREVLKQKEILSDYEKYKQEMESQKASSESGKLNSYAQKELAANSEASSLSQKMAEEDLKTAKEGIKADFTGIITELNVEEGAPATNGMRLLKLESSQSVMLDISVSKYDLNKLAIGQTADVMAGNRKYEGTVSKINRMAVTGASGTPTVSAQIHIKNPDSNIILGTEAKAAIHTASAKGVVIVPVEALSADKEGDFCYIIQDGIVVKRRVVTGVSSDSYVEITEGLLEGEAVITSMDSMIEEGLAVTAVPAQ